MREYPVCEQCDEPISRLGESITLTAEAICNDADMTKATAVPGGIYHRKCLKCRLGLEDSAQQFNSALEKALGDQNAAGSGLLGTTTAWPWQRNTLKGVA